MITEVIGNALEYNGIICHQVNCRGVMGAGIAKSIKEDYLTNQQFLQYKKACEALGSSALGKVLFSAVVPRVKYIANCFAQDDYNKNRRQTDYAALYKCLERVKEMAIQHNHPVVVPGLIGCGLAGGDWNFVYNHILYPLFSSSDVRLTIVYWNKDLYDANCSATFPREERE